MADILSDIDQRGNSNLLVTIKQAPSARRCPQVRRPSQADRPQRIRQHPPLVRGVAEPGLQPERAAQVELGVAVVGEAEAAVELHRAVASEAERVAGLGFTYDCDAQLYLRRALWLQAWFGDAAHQRRMLADALWPVGE